jgi:hypothetical protein
MAAAAAAVKRVASENPLIFKDHMYLIIYCVGRLFMPLRLHGQRQNRLQLCKPALENQIMIFWPPYRHI